MYVNIYFALRVIFLHFVEIYIGWITLLKYIDVPKPYNHHPIFKLFRLVDVEVKLYRKSGAAGKDKESFVELTFV